ncbi:MAG: hypothetical protein QOD93_3660 [Acetobacteraceae bacterium]|nr:hypothetical protein [Acetobacteraceae bacterium]
MSGRWGGSLAAVLGQARRQGEANRIRLSDAQWELSAALKLWLCATGEDFGR